MPKQFQIKRPFTKKTDDLLKKDDTRWDAVLEIENEREKLALELAKLSGKHKRLIKELNGLMDEIGKEKDYEKREKKYKSKLEKMINECNVVIEKQNEIIKKQYYVDGECYITSSWL